jgi:hypothetical protein
MLITVIIKARVGNFEKPARLSWILKASIQPGHALKKLLTQNTCIALALAIG